MKPSSLELAFAHYWKMLAKNAPDYTPEYRFAPPRMFRFDFAFPDQKVAVELEGGQFMQGRHQRPKGFADDCTKYNLAVTDDWKVLRFTASMLEADPAGCIAQVTSLL